MVMVVSQPEAKRVTCYRCECVLEYTYKDVRGGGSFDYHGVDGTYVYIMCPNCNNKIVV